MAHLDPEARDKQQAEIEKRASGKGRRYSWSFDPHYDIFEVPVDGGDMVNLTKAHGYDAEGSWSPDGRTILFASNRHAYSEELSEKEKEILTRDPSYFMDLYVMRADGSEVRRLTDMPGYDGGPFFSHDGQKIVWRRFAPDGVPLDEPIATMPEPLIAELSVAPLLLAGDAVDRIAPALAARGIAVETASGPGCEWPDATFVAEIGEARLGEAS